MWNTRDFPKQHAVQIVPDETGMVGRECHQCEGYFKIKPGTGKPVNEGYCICPYCGHSATQDQFHTKAQIKYAKSVVIHKFTETMLQDMKRNLEVNHPPKGFGIGFKVSVEGKPAPILHYLENELASNVVCEECGLVFSIFGIFGYCPDCGIHNSLQFLETNMRLCKQALDLEFPEGFSFPLDLTNDSLANIVAIFDGFGRSLCEQFAHKSSSPEQAKKISFQNLKFARTSVINLFGFDFAESISAADWDHAFVCFQKRHLIVHKSGIIDAKYIQETNDQKAKVGLRVTVIKEEVRSLIDTVQTIGRTISSKLT